MPSTASAAALVTSSTVSAAAVSAQQPSSSVYIPNPSPRSVRNWQVLVGLLLSTMILCLWKKQPLHDISPHIRQALPLYQTYGFTETPSDDTSHTTLPLFFSPRIPKILYPLVQGARLMLPEFKSRWQQFGKACRSRHIIAVDAVRMAVHGFIPECSTTPWQLRPPKEPSWSPEILQRMIPLQEELLQNQVIEEVPPPDFENPLIRIAAAMSLCYYGGAPFLVPAIILPFVHIWFTVPPVQVQVHVQASGTNPSTLM